MLTKPDLDWLKGEFLPSLAQAVKKQLADKLDGIDTKLDKFVGEIQARRAEQTLYTKDHRRIENRLYRLEKRANLPSLF